MPAKLSVSRLYPDVLDENDDSFDVFASTQRPARVPDFFSDSKKGATGAERGTATHLFLQFCDFKHASESGIEEELARLEEKRFLPQNARSLIYAKELEAFLHSELIKEILNAKQVIREQRFNVELPVDEFSSDEALISSMQGEYLAVQGVIDLVLIDSDGNISLFDYKTDRLTLDELKDPSLAQKRLSDAHASQLSYYAKAIELLFGKKCSRVAIYSTHAARL